MILRPIHSLLLVAAAVASCRPAGRPNPEELPNILWITCEDISPNLGCYGDSAAKTPVLDRLATEGIRYTNVFAVAGVCAPSRSSIITGMYPTSIGTQHMRTGKDIIGISKGTYLRETGLIDPAGNPVPEYSAVIPQQVKCFTEYLRKTGYYCTNNAKTDYQFAAPISAWDENDTRAHWRNRPDGKPFFSVFNLDVTHESQIWRKKSDPMLVDPSTPPIPPYFPENPVVRQDIARDYSNIAEMDRQVGELLAQLAEDGLDKNTIVFFFSDHGGPLPRGKREIYDSGLHVPFIIRNPFGSDRGTVCNDLVSFVDLAPTMLSLAGVRPPDYQQGQAFLGQFNAKPRTEIFGARDRMDELYDQVRCVRDNDYFYARNFRTELPNYMDIGYRKQMSMMVELLRLHNEKQLNDLQEIWFRSSKPDEELYDVKADPFQLHNLAGDTLLKPVLQKMRHKMDLWLQQTGDLGNVPEGEMVKQMWPGLEQPETNVPEIENNGDLISLSCPTPGASLVFQVSDSSNPKPDWKEWTVYHDPFVVRAGEYVHAQAIRIGYKPSLVVTYLTDRD